MAKRLVILAAMLVLLTGSAPVLAQGPGENPSSGEAVGDEDVIILPSGVPKEEKQAVEPSQEAIEARTDQDLAT